MPIVFTGTDAQTFSPGFASGRQTLAIGTASADRIVFVGIVSDGTSNGVPVINDLGTPITMTNAAGTSDTTTNSGLWYANVTTGTTCTVSFGGGAGKMAMVAGIITGAASGGSTTTTSPVTYTAGGSENLITVTPTVPLGGFGIVVVGGAFTPTGTPVYTWSGTVSSGGDETTGATAVGAVIGMAHSSITGAIGISTTGVAASGLGFGGTMAAAAIAGPSASIISLGILGLATAEW